MGAAGGKGRIRGEGGLHASWTLQGGLSLQQDELESNQLLMKVFKLGNGNNRSKGKFGIADCTQELSSLQKWEVTHQSVITLWPITGEVNNTYLCYRVSEHFVLKVGVRSRKNKQAWVSERGWQGPNYDGQNISRTAACGVFLVFSGQYLSKVVQGMNMGGRGSLILVGSEGWPVWSDPADKLLQLKLPKKLALVLIERC